MSQGSLLNRWLNRNRADAAPAAAETMTDAPLSRGQERLWFLAEAYPGNPVYNYAERFRIAGPVDPDLLRVSFLAVARREETLRTTFTVQEGKPRQHVGPEPLLTWEYRDCTESPASAETLARDHARAPFRLDTGPLTRILLLRTGGDDYVLVVTQHHILTDKSSMRLLLEAVAAEYAARQKGGSSPAPQQQPTLTYGAFAHQQRSDKAAAASPDYWQHQLSGAPTLLNLPTDHPRPREQTFRGAYATRALPPDLSERIRQRSREAGVTPFTYLVSVYSLLLYRYTGQDDLLVGTPVSNRDTRALERVIGFFNETVVLRCRLAEEHSFHSLLQEVKATFLEALEHKNTPFDSIVKAVNPARQPGTNPLFQAMFILHHAPDGLRLTEDTRLSLDPLDLGVSKFDLSLFISDTGRQFTAIFEYATDLFQPERINRMLGHFIYVLEQVTDRPELELRAIDLVPPAEMEPLLRFASGDPVPPDRQFLDEQIAAAAARHPAAVAVAAGDDRLTYAELERQATHLAGRLRAAGLQTGDTVGLHAARGSAAITGLYGILKAGGAYVPLDPTYPAERCRYMLTDSGARWLVVDAPPDDLGADTGVTVVPISTDGGADQMDIPSRARRSLDDPAYLIYTSGSSGQPKGVVISHRQLAGSHAARHPVYGEAPTAFLLLSSLSFDSSVAGIFWTLAAGGRLVIAPERAEQDMENLARTIGEEGISHTLLLPTLYGHLLELADAARLASLRTVIVAGEACPAAIAERHFARLPAADLYNEYGPTEATVWATVHRLTPADAEGPVPIGRPIPGSRVYLVTPNGRLAPLGVPGELCIAGAGVAEGYWQRPELTAEKFTWLELPDGSRERVYRTGDRATYRSDGALLYLGRQDRQVKVRGHRIELEEVRNHLLRSGQVRDAEARVGEDGQLIAYLEADPDLDPSALRQELLSRLPGFLVPARMVRLTTFPRLPNGKVDSGSLSAAGPQTVTSPAREAVPPANGTESKLLSVWKQLLGTSEIGVTDNFFSLGGDSILSIQLLSRARRAGLELPPTAVFDRQTIRDLAAVARSIAGETESGDPHFSGAVPLTPIQRWFFEEHRAAPHHWHQAVRVTLPAATDAERVASAGHTLVVRHEGLRQNFRREAGGWRGFVREYGPSAPVLVHLGGTDDEIEKEMRRVQADCDLENDLLFRMLLGGPEADGTYTLVLLAHHLVVDIVSWHTILGDLDVLLQSERTADPRPGTPAYHRWPEQLEGWAKAGKFAPEIAFWREQGTTPVATDLEGTLPVTQATITTETGTLDGDTTRAFLQSANDAYGTRPEELLLTALLRAVATATGDARHCLNLERHGREPLDSDLPIAEIPGWFTVSYPLTFSVGGAQEPRESIIAVKEQLRSVPSKGTGYGVLRYLAGHTELDQSPAIFFNYLGQRGARMGGLAGTAEFLQEGLRHPDGEVNRSWEINAVVEGDQLTVHWSYSRALHHATTVAALVADTLHQLTTLVDHCRSVQSPVLTPSDFPDAGLSDADLEGLLDELNL